MDKNQPAMSRKVAGALALTMAVSTTAVRGGEKRPIDTERSTLTVFAYKSGLFSAFADDHVIRAPIAGGVISAEWPLTVEVSVRSASLIVLDPKLAANKRDEVQARMLGPEVLDSKKFPDIRFVSTAITPVGADRWTIAGRLTVHGVTQSITFLVVRQDGRYRGIAALKQRDFGIEPISIAGGTVKVKEELKVEFDIVAQ
jgi:hypothetical protein